MIMDLFDTIKKTCECLKEFEYGIKRMTEVLSYTDDMLISSIHRYFIDGEMDIDADNTNNQYVEYLKMLAANPICIGSKSYKITDEFVSDVIKLFDSYFLLNCYTILLYNPSKWIDEEDKKAGRDYDYYRRILLEKVPKVHDQAVKVYNAFMEFKKGM